MNVFIPKRLLLIGVGLLLLAVSFFAGRTTSRTPTNLPTTLPITSPTAPTNTNEAPKTQNSNALFKVTRVIDGDTIELENGERVRYIGIDTPETVDPRKPVQCFGVEASRKNKELVEGKSVRLEKDITDKDKYNRLLRYVWIDDILINLELVKQGFAHSYSYPPDIKYQDRFRLAEQQAREAKIGLWNSCPAITTTKDAGLTPSATNVATPSSPDASPTPPTTNAVSAPSSSCLIKGNISASGEKIYHLPGCGSYAKTQIDEGRGERWFCSESEAQTAGWRRALNC